MTIDSAAKLMKDFKILHLEMDGDNVKVMDLSPLALITDQPPPPQPVKPLPPEQQAEEEKRLARADFERMLLHGFKR